MRRDPRLNELAAIGLPSVWLDIAEITGFDAFLDIWRMLSEHNGCQHDGGARLPKLRYFSSYLRFQRNRYICALACQGVHPSQIQTAILKNFHETLDITNVTRIAKRESRANRKTEVESLEKCNFSGTHPPARENGFRLAEPPPSQTCPTSHPVPRC